MAYSNHPQNIMAGALAGSAMGGAPEQTASPPPTTVFHATMMQCEQIEQRLRLMQHEAQRMADQVLGARPETKPNGIDANPATVIGHLALISDLIDQLHVEIRRFHA